MKQIVIDVPNELSEELAAYKKNLAELIAIGLRQVKMQQAFPYSEKVEFLYGGPLVWLMFLCGR